MKPTIIAIAGPSGSGKTFMTRFLQNELSVPAIISHTTRPQRPEEVAGEDYFFIRDAARFDRHEMLTYTRFGEYEYFSLKNQLPASGFCSYVVDENGIEALKGTAGGDYDVVTVYVQSSPQSRLGRGIDPRRIERDRCRKPIDYALIDHVIHNDGTQAEFENAILSEILKFNAWERLLK